MKEKPNIIFYFSDQQRWDTLGCYGQKLNVTPNLDRLAEEGIRFEYAFTCQPVCGPARACVQTGKYATETGNFRNRTSLPLSEKTIAHWLSEAGYETAYVGKWHLASSDKLLFREAPIPPGRRGGYKDFWVAADVLEHTSHGYDGYVFDTDMNKVEFKGYRTDCITDYALEYLRSRKSDKPFFLFISHIEPHHQNDRNKYEGPVGSKERFGEYEVPGDLIGTEGDWKDNFPDYLGCCERLDYNLGRVRNELEKQGIADDTIIIYTSDHGSHFRTRNTEISSLIRQWDTEYVDGFDDYKRSCHDGCIRIPLVISGPGFKGGKVIKELVSLIDVAPTILACAGIEKLPHMHGRSLHELALGNVEDWPKEIFMQISESQVGRAIRTKIWKYSVKAPGKNGCNVSCSKMYVEDFLYNLERDPFEKNNLVADPDYASVRKKLKKILKLKMVKAGEIIPDIFPVG